MYVSTSSNSLFCFAYISPEGGDNSARFDKVFTDGRQRNTAHHCVVPGSIITSPSRTASTSAPLPTGVTQDDLPDSVDLDIPMSDSSQAVGQFTPATVVLVSDKTCQLAGLLHPPNAHSADYSGRAHPTGPFGRVQLPRTYKSDATTLFEAALPRSITRLERGHIRPPWRRPLNGRPYSGILTDDIIGSCTDGAVYAFSILDERAWKMLALVQNLIRIRNVKVERSRRSVVPRKEDRGSSDKGKAKGALDILLPGSASPSAPSSPGSSTPSHADRAEVKLRDVNPEAGHPNPRNYHVDGDLILRFFDGDVLGQIERLRDLLEEAGREVGMHFIELAGDLGVEAKIPVLMAVGRWLSNVLMDLL